MLWYSSGVACLLTVQQNRQQINRGHIELMLYVPCLILYQPAITKLYLWFHPKNCGIFNKSVDFLKSNAYNSIEIKKLLFLYGERRRRSPIFLPCKALSTFLWKWRVFFAFKGKSDVFFVIYKCENQVVHLVWLA